MSTDSCMTYIKYCIKPISALVLAVILCSAAVLPSHAEEQKFHPLESYTVKYKIEGNTNGEKTLYSKDWGRTLCWTEVSESNMPGVGTVKKNEKVVTTITDGTVDIFG